MWYILLCVALLSSGGDSTELSGMSGKLEFQGPPKKVSKTWIITVPEWYQVKIYDIAWSLDPSQSCDRNYLQITSWGDVPETLHLCPTAKISREYHFQSHKVIVKFVSEPFGPRKPTIIAFFAAEGHCITTEYTAPSGVLMSQPYDSNHPKHYACRYKIHVEEGCTIRLKFVEFNIDAGGDNKLCPSYNLQITAGEQALAPLCGDILPPDIEIPGNKAEILFTSSNYGDHKRWKIEYTTQVIVCETPPQIDNGIFTFITKTNETKYNATIQYVCREPYYYMNNSKGTYRCGEDGVWEDVVPLSSDVPVCLPDCALKKDLARLRIIGGTYAQLGQFPWTVYIMFDRAVGAGTLLYDKWIITAASVLDNVDDPSKVMIKLGIISRKENNYVRGEAEKFFVHESYKKHSGNYDNDIALIKLKNKIPLGNNVQGICLPTKETYFQISHSEEDHHAGIIAGWGRTETSLTHRLRFAEVYVEEQKTCRDAYGGRETVTDNMICAGHPEGGRDACAGDSGGALAFLDDKTNKWFIGGIISWGGPGCGVKGKPGVYTKVSNYLDWIENIVQNN
ncbi:mannan-binding lectin serine protease 2-like [Dendropsophus ebraccatus]|uniref:mannan-binding lectin serine protease 2-like n=1 Tax=Dendropsophus ebraccatus TaxID=150705 RepID=UPI003831CC90